MFLLPLVGPAVAGEAPAGNPFRFRGAGWLPLTEPLAAPVSVEMGDLDGDGVPEAVACFAVPSPVLKTYSSSGPQVLEEELALPLPFAGDIQLLEVTGDGSMDVVVLASASSFRVAVLAGTGQGGFRPLATFAPGGSTERGQLLAEDVDGDGHRDLVFGGGTSFIARGPEFDSMSHLSIANGQPDGAAILDADGDGEKDVLLSVPGPPSRFVLFRLPRVGPPQVFDLDTGGRGPLHVTDLDADGRPEVLARTPSGISAFRVERPLNDWVVRESPLQEEPIPIHRHVLFDLDQDGLLDLAAITFPGRLGVARGSRRSGRFVLETPPRAFEAPGHLNVWRLLPRDVDGDGWPDILFDSGFFIRTEAGGEVHAAEAAGLELGFTQGTQVLDLDGDGYLDLLSVVDRELRVYRGGPEGLGEVSGTPFELDGAELLLAGRRGSGGAPQLLFGSGRRVLASDLDGAGMAGPLRETGLPTPRPSGMAMASWDGEPGHILLIRDTEQGSRVLSVFAGELAAPREVFKAFVPPNSSNPKAGDLDGDGRTDLFISTPSGVQVLRRRMEPSWPSSSALAPWDEVTALVALDIDGDGRSEILASGKAGPGGSTRLFRRDADGEWASTQISDLRGRAMAVVDLQGGSSSDGRDVVVLGDGGIDIFRHLQRELEVPPQRLEQFRADGGTDPLEVMDLDGDSSLDLITATNTRVTAGFGQPGGRFATPSELSSIGSSSRVTPGDFDGDGLLDLVVDREFELDGILFGRSDRTVRQLSTFQGSASSGSLFQAGDFDGNGNLDLAATLTIDQRVHLMAGRGDGTFEDPRSLPGAPQLLLGSGDLDADGAADLLSILQPSTLFLHRGGQPILDGPPLVLEEAGDIREAELVDLDGDGSLDLLVALAGPGSSLSFRVHPGNGDGSFRDPRAVEAPWPSFPVVGDIDADGIPDAVLYDDRPEEIRIASGRRGFLFDPPRTLPWRWLRPSLIRDLDDDGAADILGTEWTTGATFILRGTRGGGLEEPILFAMPLPLLVEDLDGDGAKDFLVGSLQVFYGPGEGLPPLPRAYLLRDVDSLASIDLADGGPRALAVVTHQKDSVQLLGCDRERELHPLGSVGLGLGLGASEDDPLFLAVRDLDGDGLEDLSVLSTGSLRWFRSRGRGSFDEPRPVLHDIPMGALSFPDLDADGIPDLLVDGFSAARGLGDGVFGRVWRYLGVEGGSAAAAGDFDGDRRPDVVQAQGLRGASLSFQRGVGAVLFDAPLLLSAGGGAPESLELGDFDGDGLADIAHSLTDSHRTTAARVWYGGTEGVPSARQDLLDPAGSEDGARFLAATDLEGDGFDDLISSDAEGFTLVFSGGPDGLSPYPLVIQGPREASFFAVGNVLGDAAPEILWEGEDGVFVVRGELLGTFRRGDPNGDGKLDISDPSFLLNWLFLGGPSPSCLDGGDVDDDGGIAINDPVYLYAYLFLGGPPPGEPFAACGTDGSPDLLGCGVFRGCEEAEAGDR